jgi:hypothetical protein
MKRPGNNIFIRISVAIMGIMLATLATPSMSSMAAGNIDVSRQGSLTVTHYSVDDELLKDVHSSIYRIASVDEAGQYTKLSPFDSKDAFPVEDINAITKQQEWDDCLEPAKEYIKEHGVKAYASGVSDKDGKTIYSNLDLGIYLVLSNPIKIGNFKHEFIDFFVAVPNLEEDVNGKKFYNYNVSASPKRSKVDVTEIKEYSVHKRWSDSGYSENRPSSITIKIYCDDEIYETVTLNSSNSWSYSWKYEAGHKWKLVETSTGNNYTASYTSNGYEFIFTNTYNPPTTPTPDEPTPEDTPTPDEPSIPDLPEVLGAIRDLPEVLGARRLPQTGLLWWPVPILVILGIWLIFKGIRKNVEN